MTSSLPLPVSPRVVSRCRTWGSFPISASSRFSSSSERSRVEPGGVCTEMLNSLRSSRGMKSLPTSLKKGTVASTQTTEIPMMRALWARANFTIRP